MPDNEVPILLIKKLAGAILLVAGLALATLGFGVGNPAVGIIGLLMAAGGLVFWALKIARRNRRTDA